MKLISLTIATLFILAISVPAEPPEFKIDYDFPDYDQNCDKHWDLNENGLKVKANRLAEQYRAKNLYSLFKLKSGESRIYVLHAKIGFWIHEIKDFTEATEVWLSDIRPDDSEYKNLTKGNFSLGQDFHFINFVIPKKKQEKWEEDVYKYFKKPDIEKPYTGADEQFAFNDVRVRVKADAHENSIYVISDCFDANSKTDHGISLKRGELMNYKIINIAKEHEKYNRPQKMVP